MKWDTPEALAAYLEDNPTSDAMREAARTIRALEITRQEAAEVIVERNAEVARLRGVLECIAATDANPIEPGWRHWREQARAALQGESNG